MTDDVNENIKEVYHYMSQKKIEPEGVKKKGENKRKEYDKRIIAYHEALKVDSYPPLECYDTKDKKDKVGRNAVPVGAEAQ